MKNLTATFIIVLLLTWKSSSAQVYTLSGNTPNIQLSIQGNILADRTTVAFSPQATSQFDAGYDSVKVYPANTAAPAIASVINTLDLSVNTLPSVPLAAVIPIRVKVGATGKYIITADSILNLPAGVCVYLEDLETGAMTDLYTSPSNAVIISDTTTAPRFLLHISQPLSLSSLSSCSYTQNGKAIVSGSGTWTSLWQNAAGDTLAIHNAVAGADTLGGLSAGVYMVTVNGNTGCSTMADTFMIQAEAPVSVSAAVGNVTCKGTFGSIDITGISGGQAPFTYQWSNGTTGPQAQHLTAGVYDLYVTGANGCKDTVQYNVNSLSSLNVAFHVEADTLKMENPAAVFINSTSGQTSLSWDFGDGSIAVDNYHATHAYSGPGTYTVTLTASDEHCTDSASLTVTVLNATGIAQDVSNHSFSVLNTGEGVFVKFNLDAETKATVNVYTIDGKLVSRHDVRAYRQAEAVLAGDASGLYLVQVEIEGQSIVKKITM